MKNNNSFCLYVAFNRAIDINSLIGTIGGYIGLCLGYSLLQIPSFIKKMSTRLLSGNESMEKDLEAASSKKEDATIPESSSNQESRI